MTPRGTGRWCGLTIVRPCLDRRRNWHPACVEIYKTDFFANEADEVGPACRWGRGALAYDVRAAWHALAEREGTPARHPQLSAFCRFCTPLELE